MDSQSAVSPDSALGPAFDFPPDSGIHQQLKKAKNMVCLFNAPISKTKVRNGIYAYKYSTGVINIEGEKYTGYSIKEAISLWRRKNK